jgi:photosystem II stability/assembly factor-like uncharacterized protein
MSTVTYAISQRGVGQKLILSTDQGLSWFDSPYVLASGAWNDICAVPGYGNRAVAADGTNNFYTIDGGLSWTTSVGTYAGGDTDPLIYAINGLVSFSAGENIAKSVDGGVTYDLITDAATISGVPGTAVSALFFQSDLYGFVAIDGILYATVDGGITWSALNSGSQIAPGQPIYGIASDASVGIVVSTNTAIFKSVDAGLTWSNVLTVTGAPATISYIHKVTNLTYYAHFNLTLSIVYKTTNGGNTWTLQSGILETPAAYTVDLLTYSPTSGLRISKDGDIVRTTDSFVTTSIVYSLEDMYKLSASTFTCGECPDGYLFNEATGNCDFIVLTPACPTGYVYNSVTGTCEGPSLICEIDLSIVIDTSSSISAGEQTPYKQFLLDIISELEGGPLARISSGTIQVAVVDFDNTGTIEIALSTNVSAINGQINTLTFGGGTNTVAGLAKGWSSVTGVGARPGVIKKILLVTDGIPNYGSTISATEGYCYTTADYNTGASACLNDADNLENCDFVYGALALARDIKTGNYITKNVASYVPASVNVVLNTTSTLVAGMMITIVSGSGTLGVGNTYIKRVIDSTTIEISIAPSVAFDNTTVLGFGLNTAGDTAQITLVAIGTVLERQYTLQALLNGIVNIPAPDCSSFSGPNGCTTTDATLYPVCSLRAGGVEDYYDSDFTGANLIAESVTESLCTESVSTLCDPICAITIIDNKPYCECIEELDIFPCCYVLENCADPGASLIYTQTDLSQYEGRVVTLLEYPEECFIFEKIDGICEEAEVVTVTDDFENCRSCKPSYKVYNCDDNSIVYYTESDLSTYVEPSKIVNFVELPGSCWTVGLNFDFPYTPITLTPDGPPYDSCEDCKQRLYQLTNCNNPSIVIITSSDVSDYIGRIVRIDGYPGLCWTVTELTCNCIDVSIESPGGDLDDQLFNTGFLNGKPVYYFTLNGDDYLIGWDVVTKQWQLYNISTDTVESYINSSANCPFSANWMIESTTYVEEIKSCFDNIYDVTITAVYPDCECCLNNCR